MVTREQTLAHSSSHPPHLDHRHRAALAAVESDRHLSLREVDPLTRELARLERASRAGRLTAPEPAVSQEPTDADAIPTEDAVASDGATTSNATAPSQATDSTSTAGALQAQIARAERDLRELRWDEARQRRDEEEFLKHDPTEACARAPGTPQERQLDQELIATLDQVSWDNTRMRRRKLRVFCAKHPDYRLANQRY